MGKMNGERRYRGRMDKKGETKDERKKRQVRKVYVETFLLYRARGCGMLEVDHAVEWNMNEERRKRGKMGKKGEKKEERRKRQVR